MRAHKTAPRKADQRLLEFSDPNSKLRSLKGKGYRIATFSIPAGWTCPMAMACKAKVDKVTGKIADGQDLLFRCFAASQENRFKAVRLQRWRNFDRLQATSDPAGLILESLPKNANAIRIHVSGDFYNKRYFLAWCEVARRRPDVLFYAYTKSLSIWVANRDSVPENLVLTASRGGKDDRLIEEHNLRNSRVIFSIDEAKKLGLTVIDHDDTHAMDKDIHEFGLLIHGVQPAGSEASKALVALGDLGGYSNDPAINAKRAEVIDAALAA